MNAPENTPAAYPINLAHEVLLKSDSALCVEDVARAIVGKKPTKADIKPVAKLLKEIADLGMIEMEPRAGGVPFYRLIVASEGLPTKTYPPETLRAMVAEHEAEKAGELSFLAPEDYEMPPADPVLLAMANRMLGDRLDGVAHALRGCGLPLLADASGAEDLQPKVAALAGAYQMALADLRSHEACLEAKDAELLAQAKVVVDLRDRLDALTRRSLEDIDLLTGKNHKLHDEIEHLRSELAAERQARQQDQSAFDPIFLVADRAFDDSRAILNGEPPQVILRGKAHLVIVKFMSAVRAGRSRPWRISPQTVEIEDDQPGI